MLDLICPVCGKTFQKAEYRIRKGQQSYCSPSCQSKGRQKRVHITCDFCDKEFITTPSRVKTTNYCSSECFYQSRKTDYGEAPLCACGCGLPVTRKTGNTWHKFIHGHNFTGKTHTIETRIKLSNAAQKRSAMQSERIKGISNPNFKHGRTDEIDKQRLNWYQRGKVRQKVIARDDHICQHCLNKFPFSELHVHHIDHDVTNNNLTNLTTLCQSCHAKITHRH